MYCFSSTIQASAPEIDQSKALKSLVSKPSIISIAFPGWSFPPTGLGETTAGEIVGEFEGGALGGMLGLFAGLFEGEVDWVNVGDFVVGAAVGEAVGDFVDGAVVGDSVVGANVGDFVAGMDVDNFVVGANVTGAVGDMLGLFIALVRLGAVGDWLGLFEGE